MKKLMIAAAIVCAAVASQAASFIWSTNTTRLWGVAPDDVQGNNTYDIGTGSNNYRADKCGLALTYTLTLSSGGNVVGSATGSVTLGSLGKVNTTIDIAEALQNTTYDYVFTLTGTQETLTKKTSSDYNYSGSSLEYTYDGTITTKASGATLLLNETTPTEWTVSGIKAIEPEPTPEPTSAMLMLLGVAGLALKRKQK